MEIFPVSLLPGGTYNFNFMLTPAGSRDAYYLWETSFSAPDPSLNIPDGSAGFFNGTLTVPNATIIYQGNTYEGSAPLAEDGIVGIKKNGQTYLYHPAMGQTELSEYNSRRAVGFFMLGVSTSDAEAMRTQKSQPADATEIPENRESAEIDVLGYGQTAHLGTGIDVTLLDNNGTVKATNKARRFAVVKTSENQYYLVPRSNVLPSEIVTITEEVYKLCNGLQGMQSSYFERSDIKASDNIETFGAFIRALPVYAYYYRSWNENQKKALEKDKWLTVNVNVVDFVYCLLDMCKSIGGLLPSDCADLLVSSGLFKGLQFCMSLAMDDPVLISQMGSDSLKSILSDFVGCLASLVSFHGAEAINEGLDILSGFNWIIEDFAWRNFIALTGTDFGAYDEIQLEQRYSVVGSWSWVNDVNCSHAFEQGTDGRFNMTLYGPERNNEARIDGYGDGSWTLIGNTLKVVVTNITDRTYTFEGNVDIECQNITDGRYKETSNFPIDDKNYCWFARKWN